ncbi:uncharacterized protein SOCG_06090 [Schizosaccharomyces octosporus yFS286]|uniref:Uncharacterized protein n=1 Tax=Schizosaccharomyces octosporus (strain yFS286) TaxID=483514 RepID=S9RBC8_SCHOY|nr:uncharacterized protein SOCG_06090 [Schizosaccharomyces octosporus yFS286]EPX71439.1 hypothetical protein SOCG_06090 [Schizosaccharomyces octosporus yFS286]
MEKGNPISKLHLLDGTASRLLCNPSILFIFSAVKEEYQEINMQYFFSVFPLCSADALHGITVPWWAVIKANLSNHLFNEYDSMLYFPVRDNEEAWIPIVLPNLVNVDLLLHHCLSGLVYLKEGITTVCRIWK